MSSLSLTPIHMDAAKAFVQVHHRHSDPPLQARYCAAASVEDLVIAVVIAGRPVARGLQDGWTQEVLRVCVMNGHRNACSFLYGAAWRAIKAMGYRRAVTYTRSDEDGASVRAAGWVREAEVDGERSWDTPSRRRAREHERIDRVRWGIKTADWSDVLTAPPVTAELALVSNQLTLDAAA